MCPLVGSTRRLIMRSVVVLPQPLGPTSTQISPAGMASERSFTAPAPWPGPKRLLTLRSSTGAPSARAPGAPFMRTYDRTVPDTPLSEMRGVSVSWKINREIVMLLGWPAAILMQLAHPLVLAGVLDHSVAVSDPSRRLERLHSTIESMLELKIGRASCRE